MYAKYIADKGTLVKKITS